MAVSRNPCQYCPMAFEYKGRKSSGLKDYCRECVPYREHQKYLESKRIFSQGEPIKDIDTLLEQEWVMMHGRVKHIEVIKSNAVRTVLMWLKYGALCKAVKRGGTDAE